MNLNKRYALLYSAFFILLGLVIYTTATLRDKNILFQKDMLIKQARAHFKDLSNIREWNAHYGGVLVPQTSFSTRSKSINTQETNSGIKLVKITPEMMTSELSKKFSTKDFYFKIVSLNSLDKADDFEKKALHYIKTKNLLEYCDFDENGYFRYVGTLAPLNSCSSCAMSISLDASQYKAIVEFIHQKVFILRSILSLLMLSIVLLIHKQLKNNEELQNKVQQRTKEILSTKILLQEILDHDRSFLLLGDKDKFIFANKTFFNFFDVSTLDEFMRKYNDISKIFIIDENFDNPAINNTAQWIEYLYKKQINNEEFKLVIEKDSEKRYFKSNIKKITVENKEFNILMFDEITQALKRITELEDKASKDPLTRLFNRGKFDDVLANEISLSKLTQTSLSIIFLDIDYFKNVNDTYGHEVGDMVLVTIADILRDTIRTGDFIARWGGEEFVVTLQSTSIEQAIVLAESIRKAVEQYKFDIVTSQTVSLGVTQYIVNEDIQELIKRVDTALYQAKEGGRNRVVAL
jgi:diguanylate cyclase (GGDEF)-like protein